MIQELISQKNLSMYRVSKNSGIPYTTINDICSGKTQLEKCSAETVYKLAKELGVSVESLLEPLVETRINFELYKSNVCHRLKELGDIDFIIDTLEQDNIRSYYKRKWYPESLYLLAMLDYVSRENGVPICEDYDDLRKSRLKETIYPASVLSMFAVSKSEHIKDNAIKSAIPEIIRFNIVVSQVRNVI